MCSGIYFTHVREISDIKGLRQALFNVNANGLSMIEYKVLDGRIAIINQYFNNGLKNL